MSNYGRKNISEVTIVKALKMVENGYSYSLVAEEIGCNKSLIGKWVKKAGIKPNTKIKKKNKPYNRESHISQDWSKVTDLQSLIEQLLLERERQVSKTHSPITTTSEIEEVEKYEFRVWDKKNNKFIDDTDIAINQSGLLFIRHEHKTDFTPMSLTKSSNYKIIKPIHQTLSTLFTEVGEMKKTDTTTALRKGTYKRGDDGFNQAITDILKLKTKYLGKE